MMVVLLYIEHKGLIPRQGNSSRETVYAKYGWLKMNIDIELFLREKNRFASEWKSVYSLR